MKNFSSIFITLLAVVLLAALLFSVTGAAAEATGADERQDFAYTIEMEAAYPALPGEAANQTVRKWLEQLLDGILGDNTGVLVNPDFPKSKYSVAVDYETLRPADGVISLIFTTVSYMAGGAHPMTIIDTLNLDADSGEILEPKDLFADPDKALAIFVEHSRELATEFLKGRKQGWEVDLDNLDWFVDGFDKDWENYSCLALEPGGVRVIFQRYQVLAYAFGNPEAFFPLSLLKPAGPNEKIWPKP